MTKATFREPEPLSTASVSMLNITTLNAAGNRRLFSGFLIVDCRLVCV
jgi:hypothetical protein